MILRAEDGSKAEVISSDDDRSSLAVCVQEGLKLSKPGGICAVNAPL